MTAITSLRECSTAIAIVVSGSAPSKYFCVIFALISFVAQFT